MLSEVIYVFIHAAVLSPDNKSRGRSVQLVIELLVPPYALEYKLVGITQSFGVFSCKTRVTRGCVFFHVKHVDDLRCCVLAVSKTDQVAYSKRTESLLFRGREGVRCHGIRVYVPGT